MPLIDVAAQDALRILGRFCDIDDFDRRRDAGDRGFGGGMVGACRNVAADVDGDFRLRHGPGPAGERYVCSGMNERPAREESHQRSGNFEAFEHLGRREPDLPAQRSIAAIETLAPHLELCPHPAHDARILPEIHDRRSVAARLRGRANINDSPLRSPRPQSSRHPSSPTPTPRPHPRCC
jgi:hypothetical protein